MNHLKQMISAYEDMSKKNNKSKFGFTWRNNQIDIIGDRIDDCPTFSTKIVFLKFCNLVDKLGHNKMAIWI